VQCGACFSNENQGRGLDILICSIFDGNRAEKRIKMNIIKRVKSKTFKNNRENTPGTEENMKPIVIEFEDYHTYSKEKQYEDLLVYMKKYPNIEACIFQSFYLRFKPMVDFSDDLARILY
jgi:hypothetical protein